MYGIDVQNDRFTNNQWFLCRADSWEIGHISFEIYQLSFSGLRRWGLAFELETRRSESEAEDLCTTGLQATNDKW